MNKVNNKGYWWLFAAFFLLAVLSAGCMTERSPIDQTNPQALDKRLFEGEWFFKQTIVDLPYSVDYSFIGETNKLRIIRWEITENWLIGYDIHEKIEVSSTSGDQDMMKTPVIAYPIRSHFNIQLAQNSTTGEDLPILSENHDKPWWQNRYFVIDPSASAINQFDMEYLKLTIDLSNPFNVQQVAGYKNLEFHDKNDQAINPKEYEIRHMAGGDHLVNTISVQNEAIFTANNSWRGIYTWDDVEEFINWEPSRIGYRNFFWKVDREELANNGFETMEFQDEMFRRFGYFQRSYKAVDPQFGYRDNYNHLWANYYNINNDHKIVYYLGPDFPAHLELTACSIAADYNHAFSKAYYEGKMARESFDNDKTGFVSDFADMIKLKDGLFELDDDLKDPSSVFTPDATTAWPANGKLDDEKYYYLDYNIESYRATDAWKDADKDAFKTKQAAMIAEMKRYCFAEAEGDSDKFQLRRNIFLEYSFDRDGVNPEGLPNLITPSEIAEKYGEDINSRVGRPVVPVDAVVADAENEIEGVEAIEGYPVACRLTLEHRCELDSNGNKVARWVASLGDPRYSMIYWVDTPTEYGILGVAQWSDNPESGQIFGGVGHIAGSVLQQSVSRQLEFYYMLDELKKVGYDPTRKYYEQILEDLIIDAEFTQRPESGEEGEKPYDEVNPPPAKTKAGSEGWYMAQATMRTPGQKNTAFKSPFIGQDDNEEAGLPSSVIDFAAEKEKHLPKLQNKLNLNDIKGTKWESQMSPGGLLDFIYPDQTSFNEEMLWGISPLYWGTQDAMTKMRDRENALTEGCYLQSEWLDSGLLEIIEKFDDEGYTREDIRRAVERIMFKGVAEHELGHAVGLRHNFMGSADEMNYVGNERDGSGYWAFKGKLADDLEASVVTYAADKGVSPSEVTAMEKFYLEKQIPSPRNWYMYSSVMDYMDDFYYHGFGLGGYDVSAIRYVYGKAIEKYDYNPGNNIVLTDKRNPTNEVPQIAIEPLYEYRSCTKDDLYNQACSCVPGLPEDGQNDDDCICTTDLGMSYCFNKAKTIMGLRKEAPVQIITGSDGVMKIEAVESEEQVSIQLNGDIKPYMYCPDNWRTEHPMCNVWDSGYTARTIIRNMADQYKRFYFLRFFKRGNPKFRRAYWGYSVSRLFPFAHFALDLNFNKFQLPEWTDVLISRQNDPFPVDSDGNPVAIPTNRKDFLQAMKGIEEWQETIDGKKQTVSLTPGGPGDYLIAAMEGFNFLVYDIINGVGVGKHIMSSWDTDPSKQYFIENSYIVPGDLEDYFSVVDIDLRHGHYHKNHWDFQDDNTITTAKLDRRGFSNEKDAAMYILANSGWWVNKYRYESMANAFSYVSDGFDNAVYQVVTDQLNENSMFNLSRYCVVSKDGENVIKVVQPRLGELYYWNWTEDFVENDKAASAYDARWAKSDTSKNLCQKISEQTGELYIPIHASWVYYDSMFPVLWTMYNQANIMADNMVYQYYYAQAIPVNDIHNFDPVDGITSVECLNYKENTYYRAYRELSDDRPSPIFNMVQRCAAINNAALINDGLVGQVPGNIKKDGELYPNATVNDRLLDYIESKIIMLRSYSAFWTDVAGLFF